MTAAQTSNIELPVYLDNQATTPLDRRVLDQMMPYLTNAFGNPHSISHEYGWIAESAVEGARAEIARLIGARPREIVFTSGATESNNLALKGALRAGRDRRRRLVTVATEHKCVVESARDLEREGFDVTFLPVRPNGLVDLDRLAEAVDEATALVSVMAANNEIGVIQPLEEIGAICRQAGALLHTDAAQAVGKIPLDVGAMNIALLSLTAHKVYGPKGIGALYVRDKPPVALQPLFSGGGQERGLRAGTLAPALCVGLGTACEIARAEMAEEGPRLRRLRDRLHHGIAGGLAGTTLNGDPDRRLDGNLNLSFAGVDGETLIMAIKDLAVSSGSACTSTSIEPSHVLRALGLDEATVLASIRFGLGRFTTEAEIDCAVETVVDRVRKLRLHPARGAASRQSGAN